MLYGTDLTNAYADGFEAIPASVPSPAAPPSATEILMHREMEQRKQAPAAQPTVGASYARESHQQHPPAASPPAAPMLRPLPAQQQPPQQAYAHHPQYAPRPSYWEQLRATRRDMSKLLVLALAVAVGLAVHHACKQYIKYALATRDMTLSHETAVHACYPVVLLFLLWNVKALLSAR